MEARSFPEGHMEATRNLIFFAMLGYEEETEGVLEALKIIPGAATAEEDRQRYLKAITKYKWSPRQIFELHEMFFIHYGEYIFAGFTQEQIDYMMLQLKTKYGELLNPLMSLF
jgi:hypothetical protein